MKRKSIILLSLALTLSLLILSACQQPTTPQNPSYSIELIDKDGNSQEVDLGSLETHEYKGGFMKSTGTIVGPASFSGVSLFEVLELAGGITEDDALEVTASDGYTMTLTYEQVQGHLMTYNADSQALTVKDLDSVLMTSAGDETFADGLPRLAFPSADAEISDGHFWVKLVSKLKIVPAVSEWEIKLTGIEKTFIDRPTFESLATCPVTPHPAVTFEDTTKEGDTVTYEGVPLWVLISMFDGGDAEGGHYMYDRDLAAAGYTIQVIAEDGFAAEFDSREVADNPNIIVAYKVNGEPLSEDEGPLKMVGELPSKKHGIKQIAEIKLVNLPE